MTESAPHRPLEEMMAQRRAKVASWRAGGGRPYPARFDGATASADLLTRYGSLGAGAHAEETVAVAGRVMTCRDMGKTIFAHVQDLSGKIQIYLRKDDAPESFGRFQQHVDLGDWVGVRGYCFRTRTGEITVHAREWTLLAKALRPPPEKFHGMTDVEVRYRRREVDLFSNSEVRARFMARQKVVAALRQTLTGHNFLEVETPILQSVPGGAAAKPFHTHHNALDMGLSLRIAPELFLKRLIVGGLERVFEMGRAFRNEGIDTRHNPEFTILEAYQAYTDVGGMMELAETLIRAAARAVSGSGDHLRFTYRSREVDMALPFARVALPDVFRQKWNVDYGAVCRDNAWRDVAARVGLEVSGLPDAKCFDLILDERILPDLPSATFLHGYPALFSPLAKASEADSNIADRFELFLCGEEVANAYSEQNDPDVQRTHFEAQARQRQAGDGEAMPADEEFLIALEHGMPPAGGLGIGVDRLTMILTGTDSIREVVLFPLLRPGSA